MGAHHHEPVGAPHRAGQREALATWPVSTISGIFSHVSVEGVRHAQCGTTLSAVALAATSSGDRRSRPTAIVGAKALSHGFSSRSTV